MNALQENETFLSEDLQKQISDGLCIAKLETI